MPRWLPVCLLLSFLLCSTLFAEKSGFDATFTNMVPMNDIVDIARDGKYIWCLTSQGVIRWNPEDGTYKKFATGKDIPAEWIEHMAVDKRGGVWVDSRGIAYGSVGMGAYYIGENGIERYVTPFYHPSEFWFGQGTYIEPIKMIFTDNQNVKWFSVFTYVMGGNSPVTYFGFRTYDGVNWGVFNSVKNGLPNDEVWGMAQEPNGTYWFATSAGVARYDGKTWDVFGQGDRGLKSRHPKNICIDDDGIPYVVHGGPVQYYSGGKWNDNPAYLSGYSPISAVQKNIHDLWAVYNENNPFFVHFVDGDKKFYWMSNLIKDLFPGHKYVRVKKLLSGDGDTIYAATNAGLVRYSGGKWTVFRDSPLLAPILNTVMDAENRIWIQYNIWDSEGWNYHQACIMDGDTCREFDWGKAGLPIGASICAADPEGGVLFTFGDSLYRLKDGVLSEIGMDPTFTIFDWGRVTNVEFGPNGVMWFIFNGYLHWLEGNDISCYWREREVNDIAVDRDNKVWMITGKNGLCTFDGREFLSYPMPGKTAWDSKVLTDRNNRIWIATTEGLWTLDGDTVIPVERFENIGSISALVMDDTGVIWIGTSNRGVFRYDGKTFINITVADGLLSNHVKQILPGKDNKKFIVAEAGISICRENSHSSGVRALGSGIDKPAVPLFNRPNPFNPSTTISFALPAPGKATLIIYDITGRKVRELVRGPLKAGTHAIPWDGRDDAGQAVSSGVYLSRLSAGTWSATGKMLLMK